MSQAARCLSLVVGLLIIMISVEADAQPTADDNLSSESATPQEETVKFIRKGFADVKIQESVLEGIVNQLHKDLAEVKHLLGSRQKTSNYVTSSSLCEYNTLYKHNDAYGLCAGVCVSVNVYIKKVSHRSLS